MLNYLLHLQNNTISDIKVFYMKKFSSEIAQINFNTICMLCMGMCMCYSYAIQKMCRI